MKAIALAVLFLLAAASGQWLETTIEVGHPPTALCYNTQNNKFYCAAGDSGTGLLVYDGVTNAPTDTVPSPGRGGRLCYTPVENEVYWIVGMGGPMGPWNDLLAVDGSTNAVIDTLGEGYLFGPLLMCLNRTSNKLYVSDNGYLTPQGRVDIYDCSSHDLLATVWTEELWVVSLLCYNPASNRVYVAVQSLGGGYLMVIDGVADTLQDTVNLGDGNFIHAGCYRTRGSKMYLAGVRPYPDTGFVWVLDAAGDSLLSEIPTSAPCDWLCYDSLDDRVYCAGGESTKVTVIDCSADSVLTTIDVGRRISALFHDRTFNNVYCLSQATNTVTVINCATNTVLVNIDVGVGPSTFCCNPQHDRVYIANAGDSTISVIRTSPLGLAEEATVTLQRRPGLIVQGVLTLRGQMPRELLAPTGRRVMDLKPGENDVRHLSPGVYFLREEDCPSAIRKVVVTR